MPAISIKPSRILTAMLVFSHAGAALLTSLLPVALWLKLILLLLAASSLFHCLRLHALLLDRNALVRFEIDEFGCRVQARSGDWIECGSRPEGFVSHRLTVLRVAPATGLFSRSLTILPDAVDAEEFRKLRVWLRWK